MSNTTPVNSSHAVTAESAALHVGKSTITDILTMGIMGFAACALILHLSALKRDYDAKELQQCELTLNEELPKVRQQLQALSKSHSQVNRLHHQAIGVIEGIRHGNDKRRDDNSVTD